VKRTVDLNDFVDDYRPSEMEDCGRTSNLTTKIKGPNFFELAAKI